jgi:uncharacterized membrane protein
MKKINWLVVVVVGLLTLFLLFGIGMFGGRGYRGYGMMGPGMMGGWGYSPFGWIGMIFMWLIPIGFLVLIVLGVVWVVQSLSKTTQPPIGRTCPNCGKGVQTDWQNCPYCGTALK